MKRLILIRHGEALKKLEETDLERSLTDDGKRESTLSGSFIKKYDIGHVLCSPVKRTRQTLEYVCQEAVIPEDVIDFPYEIYENNPDLLSRLIDIQDNMAETMLIVGHNPSLLELALYYDNSLNSKWDHILSQGLRHAEVIVIEFKDCFSWGQLYKEKGSITDIFIPNIQNA